MKKCCTTCHPIISGATSYATVLEGRERKLEAIQKVSKFGKYSQWIPQETPKSNKKRRENLQ
jgi:hypothetical protein